MKQNPAILMATAEQITQKESATLYYLAKLLFNWGTLPIFCLVYAYFRWLDDVLDAPHQSNLTMREIISRQTELLANLYQSRDVSLQNQAEEMLQLAIEYDVAHKNYLQNYIMEMFHALEFDAHRRYQSCSHSLLNEYSKNLGQSYTRVLQAFTHAPNTQFLATDNVYQAGIAAHQAHILRDFYNDIALGYYNISAEDMAKWGWSVNDLAEVDLHEWVQEIVTTAYSSFLTGLQGFSQVKNKRFRFLGYAMSIQYIFILETIQCDDYQLRRCYQPSNRDKGRMLLWALKATFLPPSDFEARLKSPQIVKA